MKKKIAVLLSVVLVICLCISGCGAPKTVEEACAKANKLVKKWNDKTESGCTYSSEFTENSGVQIYLVNVKSLTVEDETDAYKQYMAEERAEFVYEKLSPIFKNFPDVGIAVGIQNEDNSNFYVTADGEVLFNAYE